MSVGLDHSAVGSINFDSIFVLFLMAAVSAAWLPIPACMGSEGLGIPECMGSNPSYGLSGDWASTRGNEVSIR